MLSIGHRYAVNRLLAQPRDEVGMRENLTRTPPILTVDAHFDAVLSSEPDDRISLLKRRRLTLQHTRTEPLIQVGQ